MVSDICLAIIALMLTILVSFLLLFIIRMKERIEILQTDLQRLTERTGNLMDHLDDLLVANGSSSEEENKAIPRWLKWIASSALLIKTTREYIKSHGKAQQ
jgi:UDP-N-acetylmuramyl pentapeptide phosphotransferase/UDP-N-acetylglucosamine-1-phosphate transferase